MALGESRKELGGVRGLVRKDRLTLQGRRLFLYIERTEMMKRVGGSSSQGPHDPWRNGNSGPLKKPSASEQIGRGGHGSRGERPKEVLVF